MDSRNRLKKRQDYDLVLDGASSYISRLAILKIKSNALGVARYGIIASKKTGGAVERNLIKRRIREILRLAEVKAGWDIIVIARSGVIRAEFADLKVAVLGLLNRAGLRQERENNNTGSD